MTKKSDNIVQSREAALKLVPVLLKARELYKERYPNKFKDEVDEGRFDSTSRMKFIIKSIKAGIEMAK